MTKTKKQLRAEAVERLRNTAYWLMCAYVEGDKSVVWETRERHDGSKSVGQIMLEDIDLLTDEPETDVSDSHHGSNDGMEPKSDVSEIVRNGDSYNLDTESDAVNGKDCESLPDSREKLSRTENTESVHQADLSDTRDKLEADMNNLIHEIVRKARECCSVTFCWDGDMFTRLLDRQAAITELDMRDELKNEMELYAARCRRVSELQAKVDALEADRRNWTDGYYLAKLTELEAENAKLREKLSKALDHAHAIGKLGELD